MPDKQYSILELKSIIDALHTGVILINRNQMVAMWNDWISKHSGVAMDEAHGRVIQEAFPEPPSKAFTDAVDEVLRYGLPKVLSNALHRTPLPLFERNGPLGERMRIHQSITLTSLEINGERYCLVQVADASTSIKREKILHTHSEILKREATTDGLTGIYNRRFFDEHFKMALGHAKRNNSSLAVFMVDIDFFKEYNDHYGHVAGDKALIQVAATLKQQLLRASDVVARFGGEEFVLMLPNMDTDNAGDFAERIRLAVWNLNIQHQKSHVTDRISISIGYSLYQRSEQGDPRTLLTIADAALYEAKKLGRNQSYYLPLWMSR